MAVIRTVAFLLAAAAAGLASAQPADIHLGVASCAGSTCHGAPEPFANSPVLQNEYVTWQKHDPHSKAWSVLKEERSVRIARNLGLSKPAHEAQECLVCHASNVPEEQRGARFQISDGVGCESCHGGSSGWLGLHASGKATHAQNIAAGLLATEDPEVRAGICLDCHFGNPDDPLQFVTHEIMGAGHPRMNFELDTFTAVQPAHYAMDADYFKRKTVIDGVKTWAIGQALTIERRMQLLVSPKTGRQGLFPELVFFDCHACHEPMSELDWTPRPGAGLPPGWPKLNDANLLMLKAALEVANPGLAEKLAADLGGLHAAMAKSPEALVAAANGAAATARQAIEAIKAYDFSDAQMGRMLQLLSARGAEGGFVDFEAAEQATMAMGSVIEAKKLAAYIDEAKYERLLGELEKAYAAIKNEERFARADFRKAAEAVAAAAR
jgi:hypothetical protein